MSLIILLVLIFAFVIFPAVLFGGVVLSTDFDSDLIVDVALMTAFHDSCSRGELPSLCEDCNGPNDPVDICILCNPKVDCLKILTSGGTE